MENNVGSSVEVVVRERSGQAWHEKNQEIAPSSIERNFVTNDPIVEFFGPLESYGNRDSN